MNKKNKKNLLVLLGIVVVLLAIFLFLKANEDADFLQEEITEQDEQMVITDIDSANVTEIEVVSTEDSFTLQLDGEEWKFQGADDAKADQDQVSAFLENLCSVTAKQEIPNAEPLEDYGITDESESITLQMENDMYVFRLGDFNSLASGYYITVNDSGTVYLLESTVYSGIHKDRTNFEVAEDEEITDSEVAE